MLGETLSSTLADLLRVRPSDKTPNRLDDKLVVASPITKTILNPSANEQIEIGLDETLINHQNILGAGTNTHAQIDTHIEDATLHFTEGSISHGNIADLDQSSHHTWASLVDGTRPFTGTVGGITPSIDSHLATKGYVDALVQGIDWQDSVLDKNLSTPPVSPSTGDRYIVAAGGTGAWEQGHRWTGWRSEPKNG